MTDAEWPDPVELSQAMDRAASFQFPDASALSVALQRMGTIERVDLPDASALARALGRISTIQHSQFPDPSALSVALQRMSTIEPVVLPDSSALARALERISSIQPFAFPDASSITMALNHALVSLPPDLDSLANNLSLVMTPSVESSAGTDLSPDLRPFVDFLWNLANSGEPFTIMLHVVALVAPLVVVAVGGSATEFTTSYFGSILVLLAFWAAKKNS